MKKLTATLLCLLVCGAVYSLPIGNPSEPALLTENAWFKLGNWRCSWLDDWSLRIGYYGDFCFNRHLKIHEDGLGQGHDIRETEINTNAGYLALNFSDFVDVFVTLGATDLRLQTSEDSWVLNGNSDGVLFTNTAFSWSAGARVLLYSWNCFNIGVEGQYFRTTPEATTYISGFFNFYNYFNDQKTTYQEWQIGTGLSYEISTQCPNLSLVPYVGVKWSDCLWDTRNFQFIRTGSAPEIIELLTIFKLKAKKHWGYAIGATLTLCDTIGVTVEGRFADEKAVYVNGQFRF